ncbi:MAG TPA: alpha/beta hydrolase [Candidatus Acidoferrum sp.]|nr:alpha/beta hydrolase [Candidatus Acidoferrum sp.]
MNQVSSKDGTAIAYDVQGAGPAVILVDGALTTRTSGSRPELARLMAERLTVYRYDRRGRGDSGDTQPYAVEREIEDIDALIGRAGGSAFLYGHSSGGCLALDAAASLGDKVKKLALYEAPYNDDPQARENFLDYIKNLTQALRSGRRGDAAALFMRLVGMPAAQIESMRREPFWAGMEALAPTLAYDHAGVMGEDGSIPIERVARVHVPTLVMVGGNGAPFMLETAKTLTRTIRGAKLQTLAGQDHNVQPRALAPALVEFLSA